MIRSLRYAPGWLCGLLLLGCASAPLDVVQPRPAPAYRATPTLADVQASPPASGKAFYGLEVKDCSHPVLGNGSFVAGFFEYGGESPVRSAGIRIGDRILRVNGREGVTAAELTHYLFKVGRNTINDIEVRRLQNGRIEQHKFEFQALALPASCLTADGIALCVRRVESRGCRY